MRVLMLSPQLPTEGRPGSMAATARQIESLRAIGVDVEILDMRGRAVFKYARAIPVVRRMARSVDLIHAHFGYCGWLARLQTPRPVVLSFMGSDVYGDAGPGGKPDAYSRSVAWLNRNALARCVDHVIVKSRMMADLISPVPADVIPNGVDLDVFRPLDRQRARRQLGWDETRTVVLFPGNPGNPRKGHALALETIDLLNRRLETPVELQPLWGVSPNDVPLYMNACDAMLMASFAEGSPNVVKEAMACNANIVSTPVGDAELLLQDVSGCAVCPRDARVMADQLFTVLSTGAAANGRDRVKDLSLDLNSVARRVRSIYETVLERVPATARNSRAELVSTS